MKLLCLDGGNSRLKWGLFEPDAGWLETGALAWGELDKLKLPAADRAVMANVAGDEADARLATLLQAMPNVRVGAVAEQCGVRNGYDRPEQLGADRWAALIGAHALHAGPALVVMAGTATTVDFLDESGIFRGGLILPGLELMRSSLARNTAQLELLEGTFSRTPTNTADAILSGCLAAQAGAIEGQFALIADQPQALCLLGGGAAQRILPLLTIPWRREENLVLEGLAKIGAGSSHGY